MASFNKIIMMGNLTRDPQLSYLPSQTPVVEFGLASTHSYRGADGQTREDVCFVDCRCYGKRAETISKYFQKGKPILIEGRLQLDRWEAQDGAKRSKHRIFVENFSFVGSKSDTNNAPSGYGQQAPPSNSNQTGYEQQAPPPPSNSGQMDNGVPGPTGDDIPF
ncbi:MAG: single-stranded DNA-binding protein [Sedimentisphaerales bacterium]|nr:single-stranded DNA-binding protein [Sedimentisphaerales bacterium]